MRSLFTYLRLVHDFYAEPTKLNVRISRLVFGGFFCILCFGILLKAPDIVLSVLWPSSFSQQHKTLFYFPLTYGSSLNQGQGNANLELLVEDSMNNKVSGVNVAPSGRSYIRMHENSLSFPERDWTLYFTFKPKSLFSDWRRKGLNNVFWMGDEMVPADPLFSVWIDKPYGSLRVRLQGLPQYILKEQLKFDKTHAIIIQFQSKEKKISFFVNGKIKLRLRSLYKYSESQMIYWSKGLMPSSGFYGTIGDIGFWGGLVDPADISNYNTHLSERLKWYNSIIIVARIIAIFCFAYGLFLVLSCIITFRKNINLLKNTIWIIPFYLALNLIIIG
jgi:hypothetical protein